ncbi:hypothetical protein V2G26_011890 [Clonostachys chloroleuca]
MFCQAQVIYTRCRRQSTVVAPWHLFDSSASVISSQGQRCWCFAPFQQGQDLEVPLAVRPPAGGHHFEARGETLGERERSGCSACLFTELGEAAGMRQMGRIEHQDLVS